MTRSELKWRIAVALPLILTTLWIKFLGGFEPLDLFFFDAFLRIRPNEQKDDRIVILGITEKDIQKSGKYPFPDEYLARIIEKIKRQEPALIGLDLIRDVSVPPGRTHLNTLLQSKKLVAAGTVGAGNEAIGFPSAATNLGEVSGLEDPDSKVRRHFLYPSSKNPIPNFGLALALLYLEARGIDPKADSDGWLQLGDARFLPLNDLDGGYARTVTGGYQMLINWRKAENPFDVIPISGILEDKIAPTALKGKIVIIGARAPSLKDDFRTPIGKDSDYLYGADIHAHVTSQIISAVLDERRLLRAAPFHIYVSLFLAIAVAVSYGLGYIRVRDPLKRLLAYQGSAIVFYSIAAIVLSGSVFVWYSYWLPVASTLVFIALYGIGDALLKTHSYHIKALEKEIERVSNKLNQANEIILQKSLADTAQQISSALQLELYPKLKLLNYQVEMGFDLYNSIPGEQLVQLKENVEQIRNVLDLALPCCTDRDDNFTCKDLKNWLAGALRTAINRRTEQATLIQDVEMEIHCNDIVSNIFLPKKLLIVICALLDNAFEACVEKLKTIGYCDEEIEKLRVDICASKKDNYLVIDVKDNGIEIPEEITQKMFQPFWTNRESFGLGLYLSKVLVEKQNGTIAYGSIDGIKTFTISIPLQKNFYE